jgi:hypothetical protein
VGAPFHNATRIEDENLAGVLHGGEAVRDDEDGTSLEQSVDGFLHQALRLGVQRGGGFVEDEDRRIDEQGARNGETLALSSGEARTAFTENGVVPVRQRHDEVVRVGRARGGVDLRVAEAPAGGIGDVLPHGIVEEDRVLAHDARKSYRYRRS